MPKTRLNTQLQSPAFSIAVPFLLLTLFIGCRETDSQIITPQMDAGPQYWVRVLLLEGATACKIKCDSDVSVIEPLTERPILKFSESQIAVNPLIVSVKQNKLSIAGREISQETVLLTSRPPYVFWLDGDRYRGNLKIILNAEKNSFDVINYVPLEPYLAGVVGAEIPDYWEPAALRAQTIAARTYCLYIKNRFGRSRSWDLRKTQASQLYRGVDCESDPIWQAVKKTWGEVLVYYDSLGGEVNFPAYYSSTCGGHTENSKNVFGGEELPPLMGVPCPYCVTIARPKNFFWPMVQFDKEKVSKKILARYPKLKKLQRITNITPKKEIKYKDLSRITHVKLTGSGDETGTLRAEDLRLTIDPSGRKIKSMSCEIFDMGNTWAFMSGRGFGHAVGLCQCGSQGMARQGKSSKRILRHYYPGSSIKRLY